MLILLCLSLQNLTQAMRVHDERKFSSDGIVFLESPIQVFLQFLSLQVLQLLFAGRGLTVPSGREALFICYPEVLIA